MLCRFLSTLLIILLFHVPTGFAARSLLPATELTDVRWASHVDSDTGNQKVRLVVDVTGNVDIDSKIDEKPVPRIVVNIKGAGIGKINTNVPVDGAIVDKVKFQKTNSGETQMVIELPKMIHGQDYRVFTLKSNPEANKPFRVVVDVHSSQNKLMTLVADKKDLRKKYSIVKKSGQQLTKFIWANHIDIANGDEKLRLVLEATDKVKVDSSVSVVPYPRLIVNIKGADLGNIQKTLELDSTIADKVEFFQQGDKWVQMIIDLPVVVSPSDYKVFTLPSNAAAGRPFRVVADIKKPKLLPFQFKPGLKNKLIVIDPGHGGIDPGAIGPANTKEKTVTLQVAKEVQALLEKAGAKVIMTREKDREVASAEASDAQELGARTAIANSQKTDLFISIHANAFSRRAAGGTSTYYFPKSAYDILLARHLQAGLLSEAGLSDRGVHQAGFYVIKRTIVPATLVELAFISNPEEEKLLNTPSFQKKLAQGIFQGIESFFAQVTRLGGDS